jgi:hypothetical protein
MKKSIITIIACAVVIGGVYYYFHKNSPAVLQENSVPASAWEGTWVRLDSNNFDYSVIKISDATSKNFKFELEARDGLNTGNWGNNEEKYGLEAGSTRLSIDGSRAYYEDKSSIDTLEDGTIVPLCHADFILSEDKQDLHIDTNCDFNGYAGFEVSFVGDYRKDVVTEKITLEDSNLFLNNQKNYNIFKQLVGTHIKAFDDTAMMEINSTEEEGSLEIAHFVVAHGFSLYESIITTTDDGKIWAAVIDRDDADKEMVVRYFTNVVEWKNKLPEEIEKWRKAFSDYPVIYQEI